VAVAFVSTLLLSSPFQLVASDTSWVAQTWRYVFSCCSCACRTNCLWRKKLLCFTVVAMFSVDHTLQESELQSVIFTAWRRYEKRCICYGSSACLSVRLHNAWFVSKRALYNILLYFCRVFVPPF